MPASMISAPPVGIEYVSGSRMLIVASGPSPGSRPTSVPTVQPIAQNSRFCQVSACSKPNARLWRTSIGSVERQVEAEQLLERERDRDQPRRDLQVAHDRVAACRERRAEHHEQDAGDHLE